MFDCFECDGKGTYKISDTIPESECYLCNGTGKLDWLDNVLPPYKYDEKSAMSKINVRRLVMYVNKTITEECYKYSFEVADSKTIKKLENMGDGFLNFLKTSKCIYDYKVNAYLTSNAINFMNTANLDIAIKPNLVAETIKMNFKVN